MTSIIKVDTLQDTGGNTILSSDGAGTFTSSLPNTGITMVDRWRLTTNFTGSAEPITSNLERADETGAGFIGTGMTQSSGTFSFPTTGVYLIQAQFSFSLNGDIRDIGHYISRTTDNSTYSAISIVDLFIQQTSGLTTYNANYISYTFDVTDISTHKVRFNVEVGANTATTTRGNTNWDITSFTFIRLGDT